MRRPAEATSGSRTFSGYCSPILGSGVPSLPRSGFLLPSHPLPGKGPGRGRPVPQEGEHNDASSKQERKKMLRLSYRQCSTKAEVQSPAITESYTNNNG